MRVGVIGGGVSGLAAARRLVQCGIACVVFDTGKRGVGGRCSSRLAADARFPGAVDHAAQFVERSGRSASFDALVDECVEAGALRPWDGKFVGSAEEGLGALPLHLSAGLDVRKDVWVPPNGGVRKSKDGWVAAGETFDAVIVAHNGKCAERLTSEDGAESPKRVVATGPPSPKVNAGPRSARPSRSSVALRLASRRRPQR